MLCYAFIFVICSSLLFLPSTTFAQSPNRFVWFANCAVEFEYPEEWVDIINYYDDPDCKESHIKIESPQPSLSEKDAPRVWIDVQECCPTGPPNYTTRSMSLGEYYNQQLDEAKQMDIGSKTTPAGGIVSILNSGDITLDVYPAYKIVIGIDGNPAGVGAFSIKGTKLYTILYTADPSDYHRAPAR